MNKISIHLRVCTIWLTRTIYKEILARVHKHYLNFGLLLIFQRISENLHSRALGLRVEKVVGACAEQGGEGGAEGVGGVVGGVAGGRGGVVAGGRGVGGGGGRREVLGGGGGHRGQRRQLRGVHRGEGRPLASVILQQTWHTPSSPS